MYKFISLNTCMLLFFLLLTSGCVAISSPTGGLQKRMEIVQLFEAGTILADHIYYTEGSEVEPDAVIAISNAFQLRTKLWSQRDWTTENLKKAVFWMQAGTSVFCIPEGGVLIAPDGKQIGVWYSKKVVGTVRQPAPGIVQVFPFMYSGGSACAREALMDER